MISAIFIRRPIGTMILAFGILLFGMLAFFKLPVAPLPQIEFPTISVSASLPGASPETMATSVVAPLEHQIGQIAGVTELTSTSKLGTMRITVQFDLSRDINGAARDIQAAILAANSMLPKTLPGPPTYKIVNPADAPIMVIGLTSDLYNRAQLFDVASSILQQKISQVDGVGQVIVGGGALPAVRIQLNPDALRKYGLGFDQVQKAIQLNNVALPKGYISGKEHAWTLMSNDLLLKEPHQKKTTFNGLAANIALEDYESLIVTYRNGSPICLKDIATLVTSAENVRNQGITDTKPGVVLIIYKEPGTNIIETVERVYNSLDSIKATIPAAIDLTVTMDRTETIRTSLAHVEMTLVISVLLVIVVMYAFFRNTRTAFIPCFVIPITLMGTFGIMYLLGFSLDNLSLMALTISTGFIVDDAVVVLENIQRYLEKGLSPVQAAMKGVQEVGFTVLSMSLSLIAVFFPILLMGGIVGRLFREFAFTLSIAILVSLVISLTVTPVMSARLLRPEARLPPEMPRRKHRLFSLYRPSLRWALKHPKTMLGITGMTLLCTIALLIFMPKGFFPLQDAGRIVCSIQTQQDMSFNELSRKFFQFGEIIMADPAVKHIAGYAGGSNAISNSGALYISLKARKDRDLSVFEVINRLRGKLSAIPGCSLYMQAAQDLVIGGRSSNAMFQYTLTAYDLPLLLKWTPIVQERISKIPGIIDVNSDQLVHGLDMHLSYYRDAMAQWNITAQDIDQALYNAYGQNQVSTLYTDINQYRIILEVAPRYWEHPDALSKLSLRNPVKATSENIPLISVADSQPTSALVAVTHQAQFPAATLSFNLLPGYALGDVMTQIEKETEKAGMPTDKIQTAFQGTAQAFQSSLASQPILIATAILFIYIVLGILYESYLHPITILSTLPSAGMGALLTLQMANMELSVMGLIAILLLIGIVKKNAIMMIDFAISTQNQRMQASLNPSPVAAIYKACLIRFRPIMMTTMAALFGAIPLALDMGVGAELRRPLGIAIIGGLLLSQILTLYTTPIIYLSMERLRKMMLNHGKIW